MSSPFTQKEKQSYVYGFREDPPHSYVEVVERANTVGGPRHDFKSGTQGATGKYRLTGGHTVFLHIIRYKKPLCYIYSSSCS